MENIFLLLLRAAAILCRSAPASVSPQWSYELGVCRASRQAVAGQSATVGRFACRPELARTTSPCPENAWFEVVDLDAFEPHMALLPLPQSMPPSAKAPIERSTDPFRMPLRSERGERGKALSASEPVESGCRVARTSSGRAPTLTGRDKPHKRLEVRRRPPVERYGLVLQVGLAPVGFLLGLVA